MKIELTSSPGRVLVEINHKRYEVSKGHVAVNGKIIAYKQEDYEEIYNKTVESIKEEIEDEIDEMKNKLSLALEELEDS